MEEIKTEPEVTLTVEDENPEIDLSLLFQPQRLENESFGEYKVRRKKANEKLHDLSKGRVIWNTREYGTFRTPQNKAV